MLLESKTSDGPESGDALGFCWVPQTLDPATGFRSHSRIAYYDPVASRPNLQLVTGHLVEKILFDNDLTAIGLLQLSGIGPKKVLKAAGVEVLLDKPAVGANFQDHPVTYLSWNLTNLAFPNDGTISTNASYNSSAWQEYVTNHTGPYTQAASQDAAFLSLSQLSSKSKEIIDRLRAQNASDFLPSIYEDKTLLKGYLLQRDIILDHFGRTDAAAIEIPITATGPGACAIEKPLSRGTIELNPLSPLSQPTITYNTLSNPLDGLLLSECIRYVRSYYISPLLTNYHPIELSPGPQAQSTRRFSPR
ncbi:hypothetical protein DID88_009078 [Monilinia fructigena]|uniref:Uncharacterized protein n=1 Tax=Monilinia fructigena TaxID=38457 RepID=A0A395IFQ7_9HELO|nr:hypothetical protein DID88_009078 [Monilinia fructigena]